MSLVEAPSEIMLKINEILSGNEMRRKLSNLGLHVDDVVIKVNDNKWGPVLLQNLTNDYVKVALGRGLAEKIIVTYEN